MSKRNCENCVRMIFGVTPAYITHPGVLHVRMRLACKMCAHKQDVDFWEVTVNA